MLKVLAIIGIVLGALLVLALIILNIFLFVPFRYKIGGSNKDKLYFYFLMTFFLSFFRVRVYYKEMMGWMSLRIFGIKIFDKEIPELIEFVQKLSDKLSKWNIKQQKQPLPMKLTWKKIQFPRPIQRNIPLLRKKSKHSLMSRMK